MTTGNGTKFAISYWLEASLGFCTHSTGGAHTGCEYQKVGNMGGYLEPAHHRVWEDWLCYSIYLYLFLKFSITKTIISLKKKCTIPKFSIANKFLDQLKQKDLHWVNQGASTLYRILIVLVTDILPSIHCLPNKRWSRCTIRHVSVIKK